MDAKRIWIALALGVASFVSASRVEGQTLPPSGDSFIRSVGANANEGAQTFLRLQNSGNNRALVRFDQAAITSAVGGGNLLSATLELFIELNNDSWGSGREIDVHRLTTDWTETGVTWNCPADSDTSNSSPNCPAQWSGGNFNAAPSATYLQTNGVAGVYVSYDVTADVSAFIGGTPNYGWLVKKRDEAAGGRVEYTSRQGTAGQHPRLVLDVLIIPTSTPTPSPTRTPTNTPTSTPTLTPTPTRTPTFTNTPTNTPTPTPDINCGTMPLVGCRQSTQSDKSLLLIKQSDSSPEKDRLTSKMIKLEATDLAAFGNPLTPDGTTYTFCIYDEAGGIPTMAREAIVPPGGLCDGKQCWKAVGTNGFRYTDKSAAADGINKIILKPGSAGKTKIIIKGKGAGLDAPPVPLAQNQTVIAQLKNNLLDGECWETRFSGPAGKNDDALFKDKNDPPVPTPTPTHTFTVTPTFTPTPAGPTDTPTVTPTSSPTPTGPTPTHTPTPTETPEGGSVCGNGFLEPGETCDNCAPDCQILTCTDSGLDAMFEIHLSIPLGDQATSVTTLVGYQSDAVSIPGTGLVASVQQRITMRPPGTSTFGNDLDYALRVVQTNNGGLEGKLYALTFDRCQQSPTPPTAVDFGCTVEGCSGPFGLINGCTCTVVAP
jgi:hypothetical protein